MRGRNSAGVEFHALLRAHQISSMNRFSRQDIVRRREPGMCGPACLDTRYEFGAEAGGIILHDVSAASAAIPAPRMAQNGHLVGASQDEIGRASCGGRVCRTGYVSGVAGALKKKNITHTN